ncbi:arylacetamide deacetylase-like 2 precursor [Rattus norvegicus]|uniref:Arylacetamide deacetylase-like 2 n=1 Tax=Rattus norvegicus TaxID=10116 RepID=A0ABK0LSL4_RAT|nr:arylacetamide deacetylase-like 2 precursor [Rattus norvegicus]|eukprot:NP_001178635.1 arylacetamide deacetylase-like 2 precursor [Rattus norvegicus]
MGFKALCVGLLCVSFLSYIYTPMPDNIEEPWKLIALDAVAKTFSLTALCLENIGVMRYEEFISMIINLDYTQPHSDEHITVTDTAFVDIPVRLYLPKSKSEAPRRAVIYFHGGGFCFGSFKQRAFDFLNRWTASKLDAVVVGVDYRLAPQHHFPAQFEDGVTAVKFFLQDKMLTKYGVDPTRIAISGDSSGGTLAAAVTQQVQIDPEVKHKFKLQALLYPGLQVIDTHLPSHLENERGIVLTRDIAIKLVSLFFTKDEALQWAMRKNQHMPLESKHLFRFVNWSALLPDKFRKNYVYTEPVLGRSAFSLPALMDHRALPLLANDAHLQHLPQTYILTCQYDVLRDDGIMYASRLQSVGVEVYHDHVEDGIHGALSYMTSPLHLNLGLRIRDMYVSWLDKNL